MEGSCGAFLPEPQRVPQSYHHKNIMYCNFNGSKWTLKIVNKKENFSHIKLINIFQCQKFNNVSNFFQLQFLELFPLHLRLDSNM